MAQSFTYSSALTFKLQLDLRWLEKFTQLIVRLNTASGLKSTVFWQ